MVDRAQLIREILASEWCMFQKVKSAAPASCQSNRDAFSKIRRSVYQFWPESMLGAYLKTLIAAEESGRNLLTEKYARMDQLIPSLNTNPLIEKIVRIEEKWQAEMSASYPALYRRTCRSTDPADNGSNFSVYLRCELETYGDETIGLYYDWVSEAEEQQKNLSMTMLEKLVVESGFDSLEQAERYIKEQSGWGVPGNSES